MVVLVFFGFFWGGGLSAPGWSKNLSIFVDFAKEGKHPYILLYLFYFALTLILLSIVHLHYFRVFLCGRNTVGSLTSKNST
jgi:hypothetical protein